MTNYDDSNHLFPINSEILSSLKIDSNRLSKMQLAWISGYYWGKIDHDEKNIVLNSDLNKKKPPVVSIVSASQTGNAYQLSKLLFNDLKSNNIESNLLQACDYSFKKIQKERFLIIITSTQGEGEPPEEAISFYNFLMSKKVPKLNNLFFSIFGLGDSSYNLFCQSGKDFDSRLHELGGIRLIDRIDADIEYNEIAKIWRRNLIVELKIKLKEQSFVNNSVSNIVNHKSLINNINEFTKENPFQGVLLVNQKITGRNSIKDVRHIEIGIDNSKIVYQPGDSLGIWYENNPELVLNILAIFNIDKDELVKVNNKSMSIFIALKNFFELTINTIKIIKNYALLTNNNDFKKLILDKDKINAYLKKQSILSMFNNFPTVLSALQLVNLLRPLTPRFYSISSSQKLLNDEVHITVGVVQYFLSNYLCQGGASSYLSYRVSEDSKIRIFIQSNNHFRLPKDGDISIIMIGPGTGIAPFRAFMQEREYLQSKGKNWIFYGNQTFTEDFLYQREWQRYYKMGLLTKIDLAWSRDSSQKNYVQHEIWRKGQEVWDWISNGAYIYICGDKSNMAKDVEWTLLKIFEKYGFMDKDKSNEYLMHLRINNRYQRDVY
ncbi:Sulfite reductase [NADPH] flavoprotein alpha-component [Buchnera aphidicola (Eriosoma grossulariae)]|uniref:assimilatory sulfite reductase (NADPH) flavoprotein subunit n=1 Tax=Buchnera aphidicola TaxID=9 RepID=UPI003463D8D1